MATKEDLLLLKAELKDELWETADDGNRDGRAEEYFDLPDAAQHDPARFMLLVAPVRPEKHETIPAVTHVDGTGRLQTVFPPTNPRYHRLIEHFGQATGVPVLRRNKRMRLCDGSIFC